MLMTVDLGVFPEAFVLLEEDAGTDEEAPDPLAPATALVSAKGSGILSVLSVRVVVGWEDVKVGLVSSVSSPQTTIEDSTLTQFQNLIFLSAPALMMKPGSALASWVSS
jgi:hypothetical protein